MTHLHDEHPDERDSDADDVTGDSPRPGADAPGTDAVTGGGPEADAEAAAAFEHDIDALLSERDSFKDIALRLQADFENYRKRVAGQQADEVDRATGKFAEALLPVLDACEAAFAHGVHGVESIWSSLIGTLQKQGLEALDLAGQPFDPSVAEAVMHEPADPDPAHTAADSAPADTDPAGPDRAGPNPVPTGPLVAEVLRTGYRWKGRVLRPAMVKVKG